MSWISVLALAGATFLLAVTPGPGVFATLARALASGLGPALIMSAGIVTGDLVFLVLAIYGLAALAEWMSGLFTLVKLLGGAYLIWLGYRIWTSKPDPAALRAAPRGSSHSHFLSGLAITLGNPKVILFYMGFLPTFVDLTRLGHRDVLVVAVTVSLVVGGVLLAYAVAAARARTLFTSEAAVRRLNRGAGGVMVATGGVLIWSALSSE